MTPRAQMAQAILEKAQSDFAAIQEAMRAVSRHRDVEDPRFGRKNRTSYEHQLQGSSGSLPHQVSGSQTHAQPNTSVPKVSDYHQELAKLRRENNLQQYDVQHRRASPRSDGSIHQNVQNPSKFTALAPGRDAVLAYQKRQYRRQKYGAQKRSNDYKIAKRASCPPNSNRHHRVGVKELASEVSLSGMSMPLQRHKSFGFTKNSSHTAWVQGRLPRYR